MIVMIEAFSIFENAEPEHHLWYTYAGWSVTLYAWWGLSLVIARNEGRLHSKSSRCWYAAWFAVITVLTLLGLFWDTTG